MGARINGTIGIMVGRRIVPEEHVWHDMRQPNGTGAAGNERDRVREIAGMSSAVMGSGRIGGVIGRDDHVTGPQVQPGNVETELADGRVAVERAIVHN